MTLPLKSPAWTLLVAMGFFGGCSSPARVDSSVATPMPADFALSVTLAGTSPNDPDLEPAWYVLDADGTLRAAVGARTVNSPLPPVVRRLTDTQAAQVWDAVHAAGLDVMPPPGPVIGDASTATGPDTAALIYLAANRRARTYRVTPDTSDPTAPAATNDVRDVVRVIRQLAWIRPPNER